VAVAIGPPGVTEPAGLDADGVAEEAAGPLGLDVAAGDGELEAQPAAKARPDTAATAVRTQRDREVMSCFSFGTEAGGGWPRGQPPGMSPLTTAHPPFRLDPICNRHDRNGRNLGRGHDGRNRPSACDGANRKPPDV
jgi:hypothetical protein